MADKTVNELQWRISVKDDSAPGLSSFKKNVAGAAGGRGGVGNPDLRRAMSEDRFEERATKFQLSQMLGSGFENTTMKIGVAGMALHAGGAMLNRSADALLAAKEGRATVEELAGAIPLYGSIIQAGLKFNEVLTGTKAYAAQVAGEVKLIAGFSKLTSDLSVNEYQNRKKIADEIQRAQGAAARLGMDAQGQAAFDLAERQRQRAQGIQDRQSGALDEVDARLQKRLEEILASNASDDAKSNQQNFALKAANQSKAKLREQFKGALDADAVLAGGESAQMDAAQQEQRRKRFADNLKAYEADAETVEERKQQIRDKLFMSSDQAAEAAEARSLAREKKRIKEQFDERIAAAATGFERQQMEAGRDRVLAGMEAEEKWKAKEREAERQNKDKDKGYAREDAQRRIDEIKQRFAEGSKVNPEYTFSAQSMTAGQSGISELFRDSASTAKAQLDIQKEVRELTRQLVDATREQNRMLERQRRVGAA
jgi:hypothetical protein